MFFNINNKYPEIITVKSETTSPNVLVDTPKLLISLQRIKKSYFEIEYLKLQIRCSGDKSIPASRD